MPTINYVYGIIKYLKITSIAIKVTEKQNVNSLSL